MKVVVWIFFAVLAGLWTLGAVAATGFSQWMADFVSSGNAAELGRSAAQWPVPAWLAVWVDPLWVRAAQQALLAGTQMLRDVLPWVGSALGWLVPAVWIFWGAGICLLLLLAGLAHWLLGRLSPRHPRALGEARV
jgi:hypothetical protein